MGVKIFRETLSFDPCSILGCDDSWMRYVMDGSRGIFMEF